MMGHIAFECEICISVAMACNVVLPSNHQGLIFRQPYKFHPQHMNIARGTHPSVFMYLMPKQQSHIRSLYCLAV
jgi:hypothetical protein